MKEERKAEMRDEITILLFKYAKKNHDRKSLRCRGCNSTGGFNTIEN